LQGSTLSTLSPLIIIATFAGFSRVSITRFLWSLADGLAGMSSDCLHLSTTGVGEVVKFASVRSTAAPFALTRTPPVPLAIEALNVTRYSKPGVGLNPEVAFQPVSLEPPFTLPTKMNKARLVAELLVIWRFPPETDRVVLELSRRIPTLPFTVPPSELTPVMLGVQTGVNTGGQLVVVIVTDTLRLTPPGFIRLSLSVPCTVKVCEASTTAGL
jgi:hypothetical protein